MNHADDINPARIDALGPIARLPDHEIAVCRGMIDRMDAALAHGVHEEHADADVFEDDEILAINWIDHADTDPEGPGRARTLSTFRSDAQLVLGLSHDHQAEHLGIDVTLLRAVDLARGTQGPGDDIARVLAVVRMLLDGAAASEVDAPDLAKAMQAEVDLHQARDGDLMGDPRSIEAIHPLGSAIPMAAFHGMVRGADADGPLAAACRAPLIAFQVSEDHLFGSTIDVGPCRHVASARSMSPIGRLRLLADDAKRRRAA